MFLKLHCAALPSLQVVNSVRYTEASQQTKTKQHFEDADNFGQDAQNHPKFRAHAKKTDRGKRLCVAAVNVWQPLEKRIRSS